MKYFLAILLSLSIYSPDIAKLAAYTDYVVDAISNEKVNLCDCEHMLQQDKGPEHKKHPVEVKTTWTYIATEPFSVAHFPHSAVTAYQDHVNARLVHQSYAIFQPPRV